MSIKEYLNINVTQRDCAVCLQKCHYPTQLPCGHIFCFLCVKGVAIMNKKCAMCRAEIPPDYLDHPDVLAMGAIQDNDEFQWYYEGGNGWWKYEGRHNTELESAYNSGDTQCKLLIAGALYCIDFQRMMQFQSRDPSKRRRVRRDSPMLPAKGIAGIKMENNPRNQTKSESEDSINNDSNQADTIVIDDDSDDDIQIENSVPQTSIRIGLGDIIQRISVVNLQEENHQGRPSSRDSSVDGS